MTTTSTERMSHTERHQLADAIAEHLGHGWHREHRGEEDDLGNFDVMTDGTHHLTLIGPTYQNPGKVSVAASHHGMHTRHTPRPSINCSPKRGGKAIAADINRRLIGDAFAYEDAARSELEQANDRRAGIVRTAQALAEAVGEPARVEDRHGSPIDQPRAYLPSQCGHADAVGPDRVALDFHNVDLSLALAIIEVVKAHTAV